MTPPDHQIAGAKRRWRGPFRGRGSRHESAAAHHFSLGRNPTHYLVLRILP